MTKQTSGQSNASFQSIPAETIELTHLHIKPKTKKAFQYDYQTILHSKPTNLKPYPAPDVNWFANIFFLWVSPLISIGYKSALTINDLWDLPPIMKSQAVNKKQKTKKLIAQTIKYFMLCTTLYVS
jgi:hypothetical protein